MKTKIISLALVIACSLFLLAGCGGKSSNNSMNPTSSGNTPVAAASVSIENFAFSPATVHVKIGGTVTWTNKDASPHTATDLGGSFDSGSLNTDQTFKKAFSTAGTYTYHCTIHSMMANATVIVGN
ncbi:cupredoxin family copper-binding protein [Mucilaginibacter sp. BT774]|uniref:cupredoxin domain-containing protein n=1 Tax=Mucilaginibacter sp. BT774 TaxID=3062276 RepID=UPI002675343E|nr:cupredoxin family copper-binding protein [Mucilaginibacter sp. BT774]MDO3628116.1 cupredoxin family copper-binding protein [Mucilaginibacter sp. BT774]